MCIGTDNIYGLLLPWQYVSNRLNLPSNVIFNPEKVNVHSSSKTENKTADDSWAYYTLAFLCFVIIILICRIVKLKLS